MELIDFTSDPTLRRHFVDLGYILYDGDPHWVPPLHAQVSAQLSPEFPFYQVPGNHYRHFLALKDGCPVGRVSAFVNTDLHDLDGTSVGSVGFFECIEDYEVGRQLLSAATDWLRESQRIQRIWGPMNMDIWHGYRFLTRGFEQPPYHPGPYNKPYYPEFFERFGFTVKQRWDSVELTATDDLEQMIERGRKRYQLLTDRGYRFEPFSRQPFRDNVRALHQVLTASYSGFLGYTGITLADFARIFTPARAAIYPPCFVLAYDESGKLAGFAGATKDLAIPLRALRGQVNPLALMRYHRRRRRVDRLVFCHGGMTPEEASKRSGLGRAGFYCVVRHALDAGYGRIVMAIRAENAPSRGLLGHHAPSAQWEYALYELTV